MLSNVTRAVVVVVVAAGCGRLGFGELGDGTGDESGAPVGKQDSAFGVHSIRGTANDQYNQFRAIELDRAGRIVAAGAIKPAGEYGNMIVHRLDATGALDPSFAAGGMLEIHLTPFEYAMGIHPLEDGKLVLGGAYTVQEEPLVWRLNENGSTDATFGAGGWRAIPIAGENYARALAVDPASGDYYEVGDDYGDSAFAVKFTVAGAVDTTFSADGHLPLATYYDAYAHDAVVDSAGRLIVVGEVRPSGGADDWAIIVWRITAAGALDPTFNGTGMRLFDDVLDVNRDESSKTVMIDADGSYLVFGSAPDGGNVARMVVWKLSASDGSPVTSFGAAGRMTDTSLGATIIEDARFDPFGKIVVTGSTFNGTNWDLLVGRLSPDGAWDPTFGSGGALTLGGLRGYDGDDQGMAIAASARSLYVAGRSSSALGQADAIVIRID